MIDLEIGDDEKKRSQKFIFEARANFKRHVAGV